MPHTADKSCTNSSSGDVQQCILWQYHWQWEAASTHYAQIQAHVRVIADIRRTPALFSNDLWEALNLLRNIAFYERGHFERESFFAASAHQFQQLPFKTFVAEGFWIFSLGVTSSSGRTPTVFAKEHEFTRNLLSIFS
jgi:hypothetical protein